MIVCKPVKAVQIRSVRDLPKILDTFPDVGSVHAGVCRTTKRRKYKINMRWSWSSVASAGDWVVEDLAKPGRIQIYPKQIFEGLYKVIK